MRILVRLTLAASALTLATVPVVAIATAAGPAARASCRGMTIGYSVSGGQFVVLSPDHVDIAFGGCVRFTNQTAATATVTVSGGYSRQIAPNSSTSTGSDYVGKTSGHQSVTATSGSASAPGSTAHGSITVAAGPSQSPRPSPHPTRTQQPRPTPTTAPTASSGTGPQVAPTPSKRPHSPSPTPAGGGVIQPPVSPAGPIQLPSETPAPSQTAVASAPVEPATDRGMGLPAALAALAVVGTGSALVRVVAAEPVDRAKTVSGPS